LCEQFKGGHPGSVSTPSPLGDILFLTNDKPVVQ
jgi:hypothetical protein